MTSIANLFSPAKTSTSLTDKYTAGGTDVGLSPEGQAYWGELKKMLSGDVYGSYARPLPVMQNVQPTLNLNNLGLTEGQQAGFDEAVRQAGSRFSGNFANRGFNTPQAVGAIAGSAAQNVLPQFAPLMSQNLANLYQQRFAPAALQANVDVTLRQMAQNAEENRVNQMLNLLQTQNRTTQRGPGLGYLANRDAVSNWYNMWNNIGSFWGGMGGAGAGGVGVWGGKGGGLVCWIAGALYGERSIEQQLIRQYLLQQAEFSMGWRMFVGIYRRYGKTLAALVTKSSIIRAVIQPLFDWILRRAWRMK